MHAKRLFSAALVAASLGLLTACGSYVQTTSGSRYLAGYSASPPAGEIRLPQAGQAGVVDPEIAEIAAVEPQLRFPTRLGLARIENGELTPVPPIEAEAWRGLAQRLGSGYGEFVPVSPLIAALAAPESPTSDSRADPWSGYRKSLAQVVKAVRYGAARQHLDAVLIYEPFGRSNEEGNILSVTKIALIGFFLPTEDVKADGFAQAVLVDVRNGYTYASASATSAEPTRRLSTSGNSYKVQADARAEAQAQAVAALTGEVETMVRDLRLALAARRLDLGTQ
ncbi:MAG: hypothetical protein RH942_05425 [Kiloniellaceae bacterium]